MREVVHCFVVVAILDGAGFGDIGCRMHLVSQLSRRRIGFVARFCCLAEMGLESVPSTVLFRVLAPCLVIFCEDSCAQDESLAGGDLIFFGDWLVCKDAKFNGILNLGVEHLHTGICVQLCFHFEEVLFDVEWAY